MITLSAVVNIINNNGNISSSTSAINNSKTNISSTFANIVSNAKKGANPLMFGATKFSENATFSKAIDYYIGNVSSNIIGIFPSQYEITINASSNTAITSITFEFDKVNHRHPNTINIDGTNYADDDAIFTIGNLTSATTHSIIIDNWNANGYPLVLQGIYVNLSITIDNSNMLSLESTLFDRSDTELPSYGLKQNNAHIEFTDKSGEIKDYAEQNLLVGGLSATIRINNKSNNYNVNRSTNIGKYITDSWDYDNFTRNVSVSLVDKLAILQKVNVKPFMVGGSEATAMMIYNELKNKTINYFSFKSLDTNTTNVYNNIRTNAGQATYFWYEGGSLWSMWQAFCEMTGSYLYLENDVIIIKSDLRG